MNASVWFFCLEEDPPQSLFALRHAACHMIVQKRMQTVAPGEDNIGIAAAQLDADAADKLKPAQMGHKCTQIDE